MTSFDQPPPPYAAAPAAQTEPLLPDEKPASTSTEEHAPQTKATTQHQGYGIKLGNNSFLGLSLPPHSNGYGIRIGGVLLGVSTSAAPEDAATTKPSAE
ncbi:hypothetical protein VHEMI10195 [[Torrubiella] hemipterigena]|uniref:Uncharacterized protein n=1 Tax=[Torrubiella] hemipterigena TaxID=1531966 RepID=A0A0A1TRT2_9HYPO|nr:hypothetical protein VHEMI10195 [[Torrubiella] hemipterigena]